MDSVRNRRCCAAITSASVSTKGDCDESAPSLASRRKVFAVPVSPSAACTLASPNESIASTLCWRVSAFARETFSTDSPASLLSLAAACRKPCTCIFRANPATHSDRRRPPIPRRSGHPLRPEGSHLFASRCRNQWPDSVGKKSKDPLDDFRTCATPSSGRASGPPPREAFSTGIALGEAGDEAGLQPPSYSASGQARLWCASGPVHSWEWEYVPRRAT